MMVHPELDDDDGGVDDHSFLSNDEEGSFSTLNDYSFLATDRHDESFLLDDDNDDNKGSSRNFNTWACVDCGCGNTCRDDSTGEPSDFKVATSQVAYGASLIAKDVGAISNLTVKEFAELVAKSKVMSEVMSELRSEPDQFVARTSTNGGSVNNTTTDRGANVDDSAVMSDFMEPDQITAVFEALTDSDVDRVRTLMSVASLPLERIGTLIMEDLQGDEESVVYSIASQPMERVGFAIKRELHLGEKEEEENESASLAPIATSEVPKFIEEVGPVNESINKMHMAVPPEPKLKTISNTESFEVETVASKATQDTSIETSDTVLSVDTDDVSEHAMKEYEVVLNEDNITRKKLVAAVPELEEVEVGEAEPKEVLENASSDFLPIGTTKEDEEEEEKVGTGPKSGVIQPVPQNEAPSKSEANSDDAHNATVAATGEDVAEKKPIMQEVVRSPTGTSNEGNSIEVVAEKEGKAAESPAHVFVVGADGLGVDYDNEHSDSLRKSDKEPLDSKETKSRKLSTRIKKILGKKLTTKLTRKKKTKATI